MCYLKNRVRCEQCSSISCFKIKLYCISLSYLSVVIGKMPMIRTLFCIFLIVQLTKADGCTRQVYGCSFKTIIPGFILGPMCHLPPLP